MSMTFDEIEAALTARLDALGPARRALQVPTYVAQPRSVSLPVRISSPARIATLVRL